MTAPLVFIDTETTGLHPGRLAWEIAMIRRDPDGTERTWLLAVSDVDLSAAEPMGLSVGRFYERHPAFMKKAAAQECTQDWGTANEEFWWRIAETGHPDKGFTVTEKTAARVVEHCTRGAHLVGAVPAFDAATLDPMLRRHGLIPAWHYHVIDVEALAVGFILGRIPGHGAAIPPYNSRDLTDSVASLLGVGDLMPTDEDRHTALGDARWAMRLYDGIVSGRRSAVRS